MFTGIIAETARVGSVQKDKAGGFRLAVGKPRGWQVKKGDSVAVNGVCLTAVSTSPALTFSFIPETARRSTLGNLKKGDVVNVEQSLRLSDRLDGHIVQGHVDTVGTISSVVKEGNSFVLKITSRDQKVMSLIPEKGSVTIDGISLTVVQVGKNFFTVNIIPYTWENTNLRMKTRGSAVNIETDMVGKYLQKLYAHKK